VTFGSLLGFALVFVTVGWMLSAIGGITLSWLCERLARVGPMVERRAAEAVAIVPVVLAAATVATLVARSAIGTDHCEAHQHHAHLCLVHGAAWLDRVWVVATLAGVCIVVVARVALLATAVFRGAHSIAQLRTLGSDLGEVCVVDSERGFCFVADRRRPTIFISTRAWTALSDAERRALVAHESTHVRQGDLRRRMVMELLFVFAAPLVAARVRTRWMTATERLCDARAVEETGEPAAVASAMVSLCRLNMSRPIGTFGLAPAADQLAERVRAVLAGGPTGDRAAVALWRAVVVAVFVLAGLAVLAAEPLHHALETLLG
jgi:beta-lactamase regulating signal transducer with metallopeptidase domain